MSNLKITIGSTNIGNSFSPYVIAEISANHNGNIENALRLIDLAAEAGASAVKLQTYSPDTITLRSKAPDFVINEGIWAGKSLHQLYASAYTPWDWHAELFAHARKLGITLFSSPFDRTAVDLLEELSAPAYKIASFEAIDIPLIEYVASTGKPMIISTGMADEEEIQEAVDAARGAGCDQLALLLCVSGYPAPAREYNLHTISDMRERFNCVVGLSDHTLCNSAAIASVAIGASIIEKHLTLDRSRGGPDDSFSLEPAEFSGLCRHTLTAWKAMGRVDYGPKSSEIANVKFRRSLYFVEDIKAGSLIQMHHVRSVRPGYGLAPKYLNAIVGKRLKADVVYATPVQWDLMC